MTCECGLTIKAKQKRATEAAEYLKRAARFLLQRMVRWDAGLGRANWQAAAASNVTKIAGGHGFELAAVGRASRFNAG